MTEIIIEQLESVIATAATIRFVLDDSPTKRYGRKIEGAGYHYLQSDAGSHQRENLFRASVTKKSPSFALSISVMQIIVFIRNGNNRNFRIFDRDFSRACKCTVIIDLKVDQRQSCHSVTRKRSKITNRVSG